MFVFKERLIPVPGGHLLYEQNPLGSDCKDALKHYSRSP